MYYHTTWAFTSKEWEMGKAKTMGKAKSLKTSSPLFLLLTILKCTGVHRASVGHFGALLTVNTTANCIPQSRWEEHSIEFGEGSNLIQFANFALLTPFSTAGVFNVKYATIKIVFYPLLQPALVLINNNNRPSKFAEELLHIISITM